ncbi:unnamed protein product [Brassica napus]|uniref:(rape) hypothetical protein n=1 Tax=Brassica napus TaxID=3708 RepID=A0A816LUW3_BRANA|nr:unnamed protein product [Brassica napus]
MFRSMKAQDDEAHLEYEFARYLVRIAAKRCESKRIWCRDYINGKVEDRLLVFVFLLKQLLRLEIKKELAQIFERAKSVDLYPTEPW